jgi:hypothetical protein
MHLQTIRFRISKSQLSKPSVQVPSSKSMPASLHFQPEVNQPLEELNAALHNPKLSGLETQTFNFWNPHLFHAVLRDEPDREHGAQLPNPMRALHGLEVGLRVPIQLEEDYLRQRGTTGLERVWER